MSLSLKVTSIQFSVTGFIHINAVASNTYLSFFFLNIVVVDLQLLSSIVAVKWWLMFGVYERFYSSIIYKERK